MNRDQTLRRVRAWTWFFIFGLFISGATAIPLVTELNLLVKWTGAGELVDAPGSTAAPVWAAWLMKVQATLQETSEKHPMLFYGTDWLAFGHFVIAVAFVGALRDPVRNRWLFDFGLIACVLVIPFALVFGAVRGIPFWWRLIDCSSAGSGFGKSSRVRNRNRQPSLAANPRPRASALHPQFVLTRGWRR